MWIIKISYLKQTNFSLSNGWVAYRVDFSCWIGRKLIFRRVEIKNGNLLTKNWTLPVEGKRVKPREAKSRYKFYSICHRCYYHTSKAGQISVLHWVHTKDGKPFRQKSLLIVVKYQFVYKEEIKCFTAKFSTWHSISFLIGKYPFYTIFDVIVIIVI